MKKKKVVLTFPPHLVEEPATYNLIKDYQLMINILKARIGPDEEGTLIIEMRGKAKDLDRADKYLTGLGVGVEPLAREIKFSEEKCVSCTACIPICPSGALSVDRKQMLVSFQGEKCIACELCLPACPYKAIETMF